MKERIQKLSEMLTGFSDAIGADGMVGIMEFLTEMNTEADNTPLITEEELQGLKQMNEELTAALEAEKTARETEKKHYAESLAKIIAGNIDDNGGDQFVPADEIGDDLSEDELYDLLF